MRRWLFFVALLLATHISVRAQQGGSFYLSDIDDLLKQKKALVDRIRSDFEIYLAGDAARVSRVDNVELAGTRIGPYTLWARPKGSTGPYTYRVQVETKVAFLDASGHKVSLEKANNVKEEVTDIAIRPLAPSEYFVPASD